MKKQIMIALIIAMLIFAGCSSTDESSAYNSAATSQEPTSEASQSSVSALAFPDNSFADAIWSDAILISEPDALITESGTYEFAGDYSSITVNVNKDIDDGAVYLILNGANVNSENGTPINIIEAQDAVIILEGENTVTQGEIITTDEEFPSAALYSRADTFITGGGSLVVTTLYSDGINSRDDLIISGGTITVTAIEDGIVGKDLLAISESNITVTAGKDGLKASNDEEADKGNLIITSGNFNITAQNDGISAEQTLQIDDGVFDIVAGGGFAEVLNEITRGEGSAGVVQPSSLLEDSMKGLKGLDLVLNGGELDISAYEDAIHANNNVTINGGTYHILSGDDAIHADINLVINDMNLVVENAYEGLEGDTVTINGGNISINVLDDAINASSETGYVHITDGIISLKAMGDGIDSNGDLTIEGGMITIEVNALYAGGDSELDVTGVYTISGGSVVDANGNNIEPVLQGGMAGAGNPGGRQPTNPGLMQPQDSRP